MFADDNFEFDANGRKFFKLEENALGKEEIACYMQFSSFPTVFSKGFYCRHVKTRACLGKGSPNNRKFQSYKGRQVKRRKC